MQGLPVPPLPEASPRNARDVACWHVATSRNETFGPVSFARLERLLLANKLDPRTPVWDGRTVRKWTQLRRVPAFAAVLTRSRVLPAPSPRRRPLPSPRSFFNRLRRESRQPDANTTSSAELRRMMTRDSPASMRDVRLRHVAPMPELSHSLVPPPLRKQKRAQTAPLSKHSFTRVAPIVETGLSVSSSASSSTSSTASKQESQHRPLARLCLDVSDLTLNASDVKPPDDQELDPFATPPLSPVEMPEHLPTEVPSEPGPKLLSIVGDTHPERRRTARSASRTAPQRESAHESNDTNETENSAMHSLVTNLSSSFAEAGSPCPSNEVDQLLSKFRTVLVDFEERARQGGDQRLQEVRWRLQAATDLLAQLT